MNERSFVLDTVRTFSLNAEVCMPNQTKSFAETVNFEHIKHPICEEILLSSLSYIRANPIKEKEEDTKQN